MESHPWARRPDADLPIHSEVADRTHIIPFHVKIARYPTCLHGMIDAGEQFSGRHLLVPSHSEAEIDVPRQLTRVKRRDAAQKHVEQSSLHRHRVGPGVLFSPEGSAA